MEEYIVLETWEIMKLGMLDLQDQLLKQDFNSMTKSASHPFISYDALNKVSIPIPPLAEQARIVAILDKFDALTNSIIEGLPREIELRQKQYEYYRDMLFNFPKPQGVA